MDNAAATYSFIVHVLPFLEEQKLYDDGLNMFLNGWPQSVAANVTMRDGAVIFVADNIDTNNLPAISDPQVTDASRYGVWGRLGSARGGEGQGTEGM